MPGKLKIYFVYSESYADILRDEGVRILVNFATLRRGIPNGFTDVLIDSGGYQLQVGTGTRMTIEKGLIETDKGWVWGTKPKPNAYSLWLTTEVLPKHPEVTGYFNLDILGDGLRTMENQFIMEEEFGLKPIPVWHLGESEDYLKFYHDNYEYIAVGGLVSGSTSKSQLRFLTSFLTQKYNRAKYHFFGIGLTGVSVFQEARPYSVDFSTWSTPARFGNEIVLDPVRILKEVMLPTEVRAQLRTDRKLLESYLRKAVQIIKTMETSIDSIQASHKQLLMI